ncbi:hypothetical protein [Verrucomicrobium spinosum]|uniref:hypothetical protein n=1 Tax=Verrucomicrobium spinosum TaxID=2736 RepID=UPI000946404F|nr:hypothetical protein [Verrucomicrobium spinosum]
MIHRLSSMAILGGLLSAAWGGTAFAQQREPVNLTPLPFPEIDTPHLPEPGMPGGSSLAEQFFLSHLWPCWCSCFCAPGAPVLPLHHLTR